MTPIYSIHQVLQQLDGGTIRPWLALVDDGAEMFQEGVENQLIS